MNRAIAIESARLIPCRLRQEDPEWRYARTAVPYLDGWLVELTTSSGISGYGHIETIAAATMAPEAAKAAFDEVSRLLVGRSPFELNAIMGSIEAALNQANHVKSGIDGALHELLARSLGVPLHYLFGGAVRRDLEMTRILPLKEPEAMADNAADLVAKGYGSLKVKLDGDAALDISRVGAIRKRVGDRIRLSVDPNQSYSVKGAIRTMNQLVPLGVDLVEQPIPAGDLQGLRIVREQLPMWVEADECIAGPDDVLKVISLGAADSVNLKVAELGGLRNTALAARICQAAGVGYRIGAAFGPQLLAAQAAHLASTFQTHFYAHEIAEFEHFLDDPSSGLSVKMGTLSVTDEPGAGVAIELLGALTGKANCHSCI